MAHLEVEPKPSRPWWIWLLTVIVLIALAVFLLRKCEADPTDAQRNGMDSSKTVSSMAGPNWKAVDFYSEPVTDTDISDSDIQTRGNETYTIFTLGENILFPSSGNEISETGVGKLKMISDILRKRFDGATIGVFGSTDSTGPADENKELGKERAAAVKNWLSNDGHIAESTISIQSLGESKPVAENTTKAGRQQNRNVSIVVFPKQK